MNKNFYKDLIIESPIAYAYYKIICDESGIPVDYEFIEVNSAFRELFPFAIGDIKGKKASDFMDKNTVKYKEWIKILGETALGGKTQEFEEISPDGLITFKVQVVSPEKYYFVTYTTDVSKEKDQFQRIIESLPFSVSIITIAGKVLYVNSKGMELFDAEKNDFGRDDIFNVWVHPEDREVWLNEIRKNGVVRNFQMHMKTKKGKEFWALGSGIIMDYKGQKCVLSSQHDITEIKKIQDSLIASEEKYRFLTESVSDVIWVYNITQDRFTFLSPSILQLRGFTAEEAMEHKFSESMDAESYAFLQKELEIKLKEFYEDPHDSKPYFTEIQQPCKNGEYIWVEISAKIRLNDAGEIEILGVTRDIHERKRTHDEIIFLSYHDQLTGLYNRRHLEKISEKIFNENEVLSIITADVNGLKLTNDAFGHTKGDELLRIFSSILSKNKREDDILIRMGGDEFIIILPQTKKEEAINIIQNIQQDIQNIQSDNIFLSVSFGCSEKNSMDEKLEKMFIRAEDKMYRNKISESKSMKDETIKKILEQLYLKYPEDKFYNEKIGNLAKKTGEAIGLSFDDKENLKLLGNFHNIGKIVENHANEKRKYAETGYQILKSTTSYSHLADYVLSHHEYFDGSGSPRGLKGYKIPLLSRIISVAETWVDLEKEGKGLEELKEKAGKELDDRMVEVFIEKVLG